MGREGEAGLGGGEGEIAEPGAGAAFEGRAVAAEARALRWVGGDVGHGVEGRGSGVGGRRSEVRGQRRRTSNIEH